MQFRILLTTFLFSIPILSFTQRLTTKHGFFTTKYFVEDKRVKWREFKTILVSNEDCHPTIDKAITQEKIATGFTIASIGTLGWYLYEISKESDQNSTVPAISTLGLSTTGLLFAILSSRNYNTAINIHNSQYDTYNMDLSITQHGLGLIIYFQ